MVFTNLPSREKDAFFDLLDEYFSSRPDLLRGGGGSDDPATDSAHPESGSVHAREAYSAQGAAVSAVHQALASNPEATSRLVSAGLKHGVPKNSPYAAMASSPQFNKGAGQVANAALSWSAKSPPAPPQRSSSSSSSVSPGSEHPPSIRDKPPTVVRRFGDVDTSSAKNMFGTLRNSTANKAYTPPPPPAPAAFAPRKNAFAPPPSRTASQTNAPPPPPRRQQEEEEEEKGEWAEALYDYDSQDAGDLQIRAGERVLVTDRPSDDWWSGEYGGKTGLFPASYVKVL
ncbi:hypothetical protein PLICRDRAFT_34984 [Plicaturopsis crispa FD-325 SS-3]|nr:hypothetical protein PLICRDRAFT_34984 [Plicaturopsis crispa FD-325 SS-3]